MSGIQGLLPGSVSKYCLQYSPVPVIVVRPNSKREKKKRKRSEDPARRVYQQIVDKSMGSTLELLGRASNPSSGRSSPVLTPKPVRHTTIKFAETLETRRVFSAELTRRDSGASISNVRLDQITEGVRSMLDVGDEIEGATKLTVDGVNEAPNGIANGLVGGQQP